MFSGAGCAGTLLSEVRHAAPPDKLYAQWRRLAKSIPVPAGTKSIRLYLDVVKRFPANQHALVGWDDVFLGTGLPFELCYRADDTNVSTFDLCLRRDQFKVTAAWKTADKSGTASAVPMTDDSGGFYFFGTQNIEMIVKVINGCGLNDRYWVFAGGLTNVEVTLTVKDLQSGLTKVYKNPLNTTFMPIQDTDAFDTCPPPV